MAQGQAVGGATGTAREGHAPSHAEPGGPGVSNRPVLLVLTACHILECCDGLAQDVIGSIGQAFELRFKQYLQCPSKVPAFHDR